MYEAPHFNFFVQDHITVTLLHPVTIPTLFIYMQTRSQAVTRIAVSRLYCMRLLLNSISNCFRDIALYVFDLSGSRDIISHVTI